MAIASSSRLLGEIFVQEGLTTPDVVEGARANPSCFEVEMLSRHVFTSSCWGVCAMATIDSHDEAVSRELTPQVWSTQKPWFRERLAALQAKISSKS